METFGEQVIRFYKQLVPLSHLPAGVSVLHPQQKADVMQTIETFCTKFYHDQQSRSFLIGINPGRFGAGVTGINFTAPLQLSTYCQINHSFPQHSELSAAFIYEVINAYGGVFAFYKKFYITAVSPLGFVKSGKNMNYYDDDLLQKVITPFAADCLLQQIAFGANRNACICIGGEKNYHFLKALNNQHQFFEEIIPLPHPRFIMQYRRKNIDGHIQQYLDALARIE